MVLIGENACFLPFLTCNNPFGLSLKRGLLWINVSELHWAKPHCVSFSAWKKRDHGTDAINTLILLVFFSHFFKGIASLYSFFGIHWRASNSVYSITFLVGNSPRNCDWLILDTISYLPKLIGELTLHYSVFFNKILGHRHKSLLKNTQLCISGSIWPLTNNTPQYSYFLSGNQLTRFYFIS